MKKLFFAAFALVAGVLSAQAQTEIHPRIEVGANFASGIHKVVGVTPESKVRLGFRAGLAAEVGLASGVYLAPGVTFRQEGFKYISEDGYGLNYISVPVDLGIRVPFSENFAVSVEAGPYFAYGDGFQSELERRGRLRRERRRRKIASSYLLFYLCGELRHYSDRV